MKEESGNSDGVQDAVTSDRARTGSNSKRSREPGDAPKVASASGDGASVSGSTNSSDGEDNAADSTSPDRKISPNTSGSSLGGVSSSSPCSAPEEVINGRPHCDMERSICSGDESVSESNPRDSLSSSSVSSTPPGVTDKSRTTGEGSGVDHSSLNLPPALAPNLDERQAAAADESVSESNPRDSLSSSSLTSTPSGATNRSGRNSESSDMDQSPPNPQSEATPNSDGRQANAAGDSVVNSRPTFDSFTEENIAMQTAGSTSASKNKMTLRSGRVTLHESFPPKKLCDINKKKRPKYHSKQKSLGRSVKRRFSVDDQTHSSSEVNREKLYHLESSDTSTCSHEMEDSASVVGCQSEDVTNNRSLVLPRENTVNANTEDSTSENERMSVDEMLASDSAEMASDNELNTVDMEEGPAHNSVEKTINSETPVYRPPTSAIETGSLPPTAIGGEKDVSPCLENMIVEMPALSTPFSSDSDLTITETQPSGTERRTSRDSTLSSDKEEITVGNSTETISNKLDTCGSIQEHSQEEVNSASQENAVETRTVENSSGTSQVSLNLRKINSSAARGGSDNAHPYFTSAGESDSAKNFESNVTIDAEEDNAHSYFTSAGESDSAKNFESNVTIDAEEDSLHAITPAVHYYEQQEPLAAPDSSTEEIKEEITSNTATEVQQQMSTNISHSSATDVTIDETTRCTSGTEDKTVASVSQDTGSVDSPEENSMSSALLSEEQYCQRELQIYRYIATNGSPDIRYSPYITRRRPLRSGISTQRDMGALRAAYGDGGGCSRDFPRMRHHGARQADDSDHQNTSGSQASVGDTCSIS